LFNHIRVIVFVMYSAAFVAASGVAAGDEQAGEKISAERQVILRDMRKAVEAMSVSEKKGETLQVAKAVGEPIFRYCDPQRQIVDGTMWVWTVDGLPVMTMKLDYCSLPEPERRWLFNVGSCSGKSRCGEMAVRHAIRNPKARPDVSASEQWSEAAGIEIGDDCFN
jgi:hypothetical protein